MLKFQHGGRIGDNRHFEIGAGPAGLTTAYCLAKAGHGAIVIEQDKHYVGGISRTVSDKGFLFDIGGHRFFSKSREVVAQKRFGG